MGGRSGNGNRNNESKLKWESVTFGKRTKSRTSTSQLYEAKVYEGKVEAADISDTDLSIYSGASYRYRPVNDNSFYVEEISIRNKVPDKARNLPGIRTYHVFDRVEADGTRTLYKSLNDAFVKNERGKIEDKRKNLRKRG